MLLVGALLFALIAAPVRAQKGGDSKKESIELLKCDKPMGAIAIVEPQDAIERALAAYKLGPPTGLIRMMIQQSNCFRVVERGAAMKNIMQERALAESGQLRQGSNIGGGQLVAADYLIEPSVEFSEPNAGGIGGAFAAIGGRLNPLVGVVAGGLRFKEAATTMTLSDGRTGELITAMQGKARKADWGLGGLGGNASAGAGLGAYSNTNEGKVVAASFVDNFNKIIDYVRNDTTLRRRSSASVDAAGGPADSGPSYREGDVVSTKIANVRLYADPSESAKVLASLPKGEDMVFLGNKQDGFLFVQAPNASGWVKSLLVVRK